MTNTEGSEELIRIYPRRRGGGARGVLSLIPCPAFVPLLTLVANDETGLM